MSSEMTLLLPDWDDDQRMNFLFSDFKENRDVNPSDWDSKLDFWTAAVVQSCRDRGTVSFSLQELSTRFRRKGTSPLGLVTVIQCMAGSGKIQRESEFAASVDCGWLSWGVGLLLVKPLKWTFSTFWEANHVPLQESFVIFELVKEKAAQLLKAYRSSEFAGRSVLSFQDLCALSSGVCADESTLCMALLQLQRDKQVSVLLHEGEKMIKFAQPGQDRVSPVNDMDVGIYQLQCSERLLGERVEALTVEADKCKEETRQLLRKGKKTQALRCLKGSKKVEKRLDNLFAKLETIRGILDRIAHAQTDKMVLQTYQAGVAALRLSLKDVTVERAENLVDQIQELCDTQDEVSQTIATGMSSADEYLDELDEELKSLLEEPKPEPISPLPQVPSYPLPTPSRQNISADDLLSSLPAVPQGHFTMSTEQLEEELKHLALRDSGFPQKQSLPSSKRLESAQ
ncbi:charged multivesicular body protein 7 [Thalassophryne amazonica]|uniref:charged multivesicular body protein 7 n=1 Tax=Thalassophryne amazonica TaxID=390379 RepID=UPI0014710E34|nr:charged multivesicular body protein 7 [Thalassophryne amazonica]